MDRATILEKLGNKKIKDYSFTIGFFLVFSFFVFFAIRPNILTAFSLEKELDELRLLDKDYEDAIIKIVQIQSILEENRERMYLMDQALPKQPYVNQVLEDINTKAAEYDMKITKLNVNQVEVKEKKSDNKTRSFQVFMEVKEDFDKTKQYIDGLISQRRLKSLKSLNFKREDSNSASDSAKTIIIRMEIENYYL